MEVLIVDDEPIAQRLLQSYVLKLPQLQLAGVAGNAVEAFGIISTQQVDLLLLDINLPEISGIAFVKTLKHAPPVIFTTAYSEYAVESYELDAVDYLVKPIPFERFLKAIDKAADIQKKLTSETEVATRERLIFVKCEGKLVSIQLAQLWFIEGLKDYVRFWTESGRYLVLATMQHIEEQLAEHLEFIRVSRSYIINVHHIREVDGNAIIIKDQSIAIGNTYRSEVWQFLERLRLV